MNQEILKFFVKKGFLLDNEMLNFFSELKDEEVANRIVEKIKMASSERIITKSLVDKNLEDIEDVFYSLEGEKKKIVDRFFVNLSLSVEIKKEKFIEKKEEIEEGKETKGEANQLQIVFPYITPPRKLVVKDFVKHFRNRYMEMKSLLQERNELQNLSSLDRITGQRQNLSVIVLVSNKRITKNKNLLFEIEDLTGRGLALVNQNKPELFQKAQDMILDDVVGLRCSGNREMLFVNDILYPDAMVLEKKKIDEEVCALFTSDLHIGSDKFFEENFLRFIDWLNGKINHKQEIKKIKYLFFTGDNVDGVGVFPGQESSLKIKNIKDQYDKLFELLKLIREDVRIIMCPGQHDAVRVAEPQPIIDKFFAPKLHKLKNLTLVTNPCNVLLKEGFNILMYHGAGFHGLINSIESLRMNNPYNKPTQIHKHLLKRRHLAPTHSNVIYIPGEKDPMMIRQIPDVLTTGEMHKLDVDSYNNILTIANACWQGQTPYEEKVGNHPDPCKVSMLNFKTRDIKILDFS